MRAINCSGMKLAPYFLTSRQGVATAVLKKKEQKKRGNENSRRIILCVMPSIIELFKYCEHDL